MIRANLIIAIFAALTGWALAHTTLKSALNLTATLAQAEATKGM